MSSVSTDMDYTTKTYDLQTLRSWARQGVSEGPLKRFKIRPDESFSPLSTKPKHEEGYTSSQHLLTKFATYLQPFLDIKVFDPKHDTYSQTIRASFDIGTAVAFTKCFMAELAQWTQVQTPIADPAQFMQLLTKGATKRLLTDLTLESLVSQITEKLAATGFVRQEYTFNRLNVLVFTARNRVSSDDYEFQYDVAWDPTLVTDVRPGTGSNSMADLLAPLPDERDIPIKALTSDDDFGDFKSDVDGIQVGHDS